MLSLTVKKYRFLIWVSTADDLGTTHDTRHTTHSARPHPGNNNSPSLRSTSCQPKNQLTEKTRYLLFFFVWLPIYLILLFQIHQLLYYQQSSIQPSQSKKKYLTLLKRLISKYIEHLISELHARQIKNFSKINHIYIHLNITK